MTFDDIYIYIYTYVYIHTLPPSFSLYVIRLYSNAYNVMFLTHVHIYNYPYIYVLCFLQICLHEF